MPWDLNGRLAYQWVGREGEHVSTLDLLGDGLTVLAHPAEPGWIAATKRLRTRVPVTTHVVDEVVADSLGIPYGGAVLVRPDGRQVLECGPGHMMGDIFGKMRFGILTRFA